MLERKSLAIFSPSKRKTNTIGIIVPKLDCHFITSALRGIGEISSQHGYELVITHSQGKMTKELENANMLLSNGVNGIIASLTADNDCALHFSAIVGKNVPVLLFDRSERSIPCDKVVTDNVRCGYMATEHLIRQGCKRIAFVSSCGTRNAYGQRYQGFRKALDRYGLPFSEDLLILADNDRDSGAYAARTVLSGIHIPDGMFITNHLAAAECIHSLIAHGIRVPEDIAIVGFNNDPVASLIWPALSTINCSGLAIGKAAATKLIRHLSGSASLTGLGTSLVPSTLIVRDSSVKKINQ